MYLLHSYCIECIFPKLRFVLSLKSHYENVPPTFAQFSLYFIFFWVANISSIILYKPSNHFFKFTQQLAFNNFISPLFLIERKEREKLIAISPLKLASYKRKNKIWYTPPSLERMAKETGVKPWTEIAPSRWENHLLGYN